MNTKRRDRGITLIELLVVMVIIAMFATLVGQRIFRNVEKARQVAAKSQISEFETVLDTYQLDIGHYPTNEEGLQALRTRPGISKSGMVHICGKTYLWTPGAILMSTVSLASTAITT